MIWLIVLLCTEIVARTVLEIREARLTQVHGGAFAFLRLLPLVNDIVPLPEFRGQVPESDFVRKHEEGHRYHHHAVLRNLLKAIFVMLAVGFIIYLLVRESLPVWQCILWLHLVAIPSRMVFHLYCWFQEYEADFYAFKELGKQKAKSALNALRDNEIPHTNFFALVYREHPTALARRKRLLNR